MDRVSVPEEPAWLAEATASGPTADPTAPAPPVDPKAIAAARKARAAEIVKALNPEQARAVTTTEGPLLITWPAAPARPASSRTGSRTSSASTGGPVGRTLP